MEQVMRHFYEPGGIAVVGASNNPIKPGYSILHNMLEKGYAGGLYPVNPKEDTVQGLPAFPSLAAVDGTVDLVVLITPAAAIGSVMDDLELRMAQKGDVRALVCAAAGYAEVKTENGIAAQRRLMETTQKHGIRVLGPNCIGVINNRNGVDTTFVDPGLAPSAFKTKSGISVVSQSGSVATSIMFMGTARPEPLEFNKFASVGNMADIDFIDILEYYEQDDTTKVIGMYIEGYPDGRKLIETLGRIARKKPVVVLKVGRSSKGAKAASSHTGSLAGTDAVYDAAFRQCGVVRVDTFGEMIDLLVAFDRMPPLRGGSTYILSQTGGFGIYSVDLVEKTPAIRMPRLSDETARALREAMPAMSMIEEPEGYSDITVSASEAQHAEALKLVLQDDAVDNVLLVTVTPSFLSQEKLGGLMRDAYHGLPAEYQKPVCFCIMAGDYVTVSRRQLEQGGLCTFDTPLEAMRTMAHLLSHSDYIKNQEGCRDETTDPLA